MECLSVLASAFMQTKVGKYKRLNVVWDANARTNILYPHFSKSDKTCLFYSFFQVAAMRYACSSGCFQRLWQRTGRFALWFQPWSSSSLDFWDTWDCWVWLDAMRWKDPWRRVVWFVWMVLNFKCWVCVREKDAAARLLEWSRECLK